MADARVYCYGCGETMASAEAVWHTGEPYCAVCEAESGEALADEDAMIAEREHAGKREGA